MKRTEFDGVCPHCGGDNIDLLQINGDTADRECLSCGHKFQTVTVEYVVDGTENGVTQLGLAIPTKFGVFHVGDEIECLLYQRTVAGGTERVKYRGTIVFDCENLRYVLDYSTDGPIQSTYHLDFAEKPKLIKSWNKK